MLVLCFALAGFYLRAQENKPAEKPEGKPTAPSDPSENLQQFTWIDEDAPEQSSSEGILLVEQEWHKSQAIYCNSQAVRRYPSCAGSQSITLHSLSVRYSPDDSLEYFPFGEPLPFRLQVEEISRDGKTIWKLRLSNNRRSNELVVWEGMLPEASNQEQAREKSKEIAKRELYKYFMCLRNQASCAP